MAQVLAKGDNLNELNQKFVQAPLAEPAFLNSVPKCGTHLLRNIMRMFVPVAQQYHRAFIQLPLLRQHPEAFARNPPFLSWGHLLFTDDSAMALEHVHHVVLVRDPYDWVLARARFFLSDTFKGPVDHLKTGRASVEEVLNMMILGIHDKVPHMQEIFLHNAVGWLGTKARVVHYEELVQHLAQLDSAAAENYFPRIAAGLRHQHAAWRLARARHHRLRSQAERDGARKPQQDCHGRARRAAGDAATPGRPDRAGTKGNFGLSLTLAAELLSVAHPRSCISIRQNNRLFVESPHARWRAAFAWIGHLAANLYLLRYNRSGTVSQIAAKPMI